MNNKLRQTLGKRERLHGKSQISRLFTKGNTFYIYPFKVIYLTETSDEPERPKILISVSKKNLKKAVDRNKVKRLVREAYRTNKALLFEESRSSLLFGLIYTAKTILSYTEIEKKIILILHRLKEQDE